MGRPGKKLTADNVALGGMKELAEGSSLARASGIGEDEKDEVDAVRRAWFESVS